MKKLGRSLVLGVWGLLVMSSVALANEGTVSLTEMDGSGSNCQASSVYMGNEYQVLASCRGLVVPYSAEKTRYIMWAVDDKKEIARVGEVVRGKLSEVVNKKFTELMLTAEEKTLPRKPGESIVARGVLEEYDFDGDKLVSEDDKKELPEATITLYPEVSGEGTLGEVQTEPQKSILAKILGVIGRIVGVGILLVLISGAIIAVVSRRREQQGQ